MLFTTAGSLVVRELGARASRVLMPVKSLMWCSACSRLRESEAAGCQSSPLDVHALSSSRMGGIPARNAKGERLLLYIGIIDVLQSYRSGTTWSSWVSPQGTARLQRGLPLLECQETPVGEGTVRPALVSSLEQRAWEKGAAKGTRSHWCSGCAGRCGQELGSIAAAL